MNSISIKPVIYAQYKRADGTYGVRLRITYNRKSRYITTNMTASPGQLTRGLKIKDLALERKVDALVRELRDKASGLGLLELAAMEVDEVVAYLVREEREEFRLDFPTFARGQIAAMGAGAKNYTSAVNSLCAFMERERFDISALSSSTLERWEVWLTARHGKGARALSLYTQAVKHLHEQARRLYNDEEEGVLLIRNPFARYRCPAQSQGRHRNAPPELVEGMLRRRAELQGRERLGVDAFLLSFGLMGANAPDMYECRIEEGVVLYNRRKTRDRRQDGAEMRVRIEPQVESLAREYTRADGTGFTFASRYCSFKEFGRAVNIGLHAYAERIGWERPLTLYVARHTWATVARSSACNIDKGVVNDCICHIDQGTRVTDIYAEKDWRVMWEANQKVVALFAW